MTSLSVICRTDIRLSVTLDNLPVMPSYENVRRVESVRRDLEVTKVTKFHTKR